MACQSGTGNRKISAVELSKIVKRVGPPEGTTEIEWVAKAIQESSLRVDCVNELGCVGPWQICPVNFKIVGMGQTALKDPRNNFRAAKIVYLRQGWDAWRASGGKPSNPQAIVLPHISNPDVLRELTDVTPGGIPKGIESVIDTADSLLTEGFGSTAEFLGQVFPAITAAAGWLGNPANWIRIIQVAGGGVLVLVAANIVARPFIGPAVEQAASALPAGRLAKLAK